MTDERFHRMTIAALVVVAFIAALVSFVHIYSWASAHHQLPFAAAMYPFSVDALVAVTTFSMFRAKKRGDPIPPVARITLGLAVTATLAANFGYGLPYGLVSALISCWPAAAFVLAVECAVKMVRKSPEPKPVIQKVPTPATVKQTVKRAPARKKQKKAILTRARATEIAEERGVSPRTVRNHPEWWTLEVAT